MVRFSVIWSKQGNNLPFDVRYNCIATMLQNVWASVQLYKLFEEFCGKDRERIPCFLPETQLNWIKYSHNSTHRSRQLLVTHTIHQNEIPTLLDSWVTNTLFVKILCPQKNYFNWYFHKNITCHSVDLLRIGQVVTTSCKIVDRWVTTNCCFMNDIQYSLYF